MTVSHVALLALVSALIAILMLGTTHIKTSLRIYTLHTLCLSLETFMIARAYSRVDLYYVAVVVLALKAFLVPIFLQWIISKLAIQKDSAIFIPAAICMHLGFALLVVSYVILLQIPSMLRSTGPGAVAALSLIFTSMLLMLTRRIAITQILGFLVLENGIFLFALTQTHGMPMMIEMGLLLELLVAVMIAGLLVFRIKKNFEHVDVTLLTELKD